MIPNLSGAARIAAAAAIFFTASPVMAGDGIEGSAHISKRVPADILVLSFDLVEHASAANPGGPGRDAVLRAAIEKTGAEILSWSNIIVKSWHGQGASGTGSTRETVDAQITEFTRRMRIRLIKASNIETIAETLGRVGVRQAVGYEWTSERIEEEKDRLDVEALAQAADKARAHALKIGAKPGRVLNARITLFPISPPNATATTVVQTGTVQTGGTTSVGFSRYEVVEDHTGRYILLRTTATVAVEAAP